MDPSRATQVLPYFRETPADAVQMWRDAKPGDRLQPEVLWVLLYRQRPADVSVELVQRAFSYDEAFLRAQAARVAMVRHPERDDLARQTFSDDHPRVFAAGLEGLLSEWGGSDAQVRLERIRQILAAGLTPERATVTLGILENFEDVGGWYDREKLPAEPWALLTASSLRIVSPSDRVDAEHLNYYAMRVLDRVEKTLALDVLDAWVGWAERAVKTTHHSDATVCVARLWFLVTDAKASLREGVVERLLNQPDTTFFVNAVANLVDNWPLLDSYERGLLLETLDGSRPDARWARAVALTRTRPPAEIVCRLLGSEDALQLMFRRRLEPVDRRILGDCVRLYDDVGGAADLGACRALWRLIVLLSAEPDHPLFASALYFCVANRRRSGVMGLWKRYIWLGLCCKADEGLRERLFQCLLRATIVVNSGHFPELWLPLLDTAGSDAVIERWAKQVGDNIEAIDRNKNVNIFLDHSRIAPSIARQIQRDIELFNLIEDDLFLKDPQPLIRRLYNDGSPRLLPSHDEALRALGVRPGPPPEEPSSDPLADRVLAARHESIEAGSRQNEAAYDASRRPIEDWVWLYRSAHAAEA